jgi:REP element-mobilizing transposase RayT
MARGNNGQKVFLKPGDYDAFLTALGTVRERYRFYLYAYVLMPNHFHLLLEVIKAPTARILQSLLTAYVRGFNRVHRRRGHLFQGRYKAIVCDRDSYLLELVRYIHLNPVRAGLVKRPGEWKWSGHGEYLRRRKRGLIDAGPVMEELRSPARYEVFVREGIQGGYRAEWHPGDNAPFLGAEEFVKRVVKQKATSARPAALEVLWKEMAREGGLSPQALRRGGRSGRLVELRHLLIRRAVLEEGYRASEVAAFLGCHPSSVTRALQEAE